jgi:DNA invertase Pin-like site-specific DNA recombinase
MSSVAAIYVRQSRHKDYDRTVSPEDQEAQCRALPAVAACDEIEVYRDLDLSGGSTRKRPGLLALLERVKSGGVAIVAALDQSRAFRNTADALAFYALMETRPEIAVVFVHGRFDRSAVGGFTYTTLAAAHEMERRMTGEKIASALHYMIGRGEMVSKVPLGYRRIIDGQAQRIELDPEWAPVVLRAFEEYASGRFTTRELINRLNSEGLRPPKTKGGWRASGLARVLRSPAYIGMTPVDGRSSRGQLAPGQWPALVPREVFDAAQAVLDRRTKGGGRGPHGRTYAFQNLLRCADCGTALYAHTVHSVAYYRCRDGGPIGCGQAVREDRLVPWGRSLLSWLESAKDWPDLSAARDALLDRPSRPPDALAQIDASLERVGQRFEWGDIDAQDYREKRERLLGLRNEVLSANTPSRRLIPVAGLVEAWDGGDPIIRRALLANIFTAIEVRGGQVVRATPRPEVAGEVEARLRGWRTNGRELSLRYG